MFCQSEVPNGRCDLGSLNSVVAVFSRGVTTVKKKKKASSCFTHYVGLTMLAATKY